MNRPGFDAEVNVVGTVNTLEAALSLVGNRIRANGSLALAVEGARIARRVSCGQCGASRAILRIAGRLRPGDRLCPQCNGVAVASGFGTLETLEAASLTRAERQRSLRSVGLEYGEIIRGLGGDLDLRFELVRP